MTRLLSLPYQLPDGRTWQARLRRRAPGKYQIDYFDSQRRRTREGFEAGSDAEAIEAFRAWVEDVVPQRLAPKPAERLTADSPLHRLADWYVDVFMVANGRRDDSRTGARGDLDQVCDWLATQGVHTPADLQAQPGTMTRYAAHLRTQGYRPRTTNRKVARLKWVLQSAWQEGFLAEIPVRRWPRESVPDTIADAATPAETQALVEYLRARGPGYGGGQFLNVATFMAQIGCRPSDACALTWDRVDIEHGIVRILQTKTGRLVEAELVGPARAAVLAEKLRRTGDPHVFTNWKGKPWTAGSLGASLRYHATAATGRRIGPRMLRANVVTIIREAGGDDRDVGDVSGHRSRARESYQARRAERRREMAHTISNRLWTRTDDTSRDTSQPASDASPDGTTD